ncbi:MAG: hypothetical protein JJ847_05475 [Prochlorococcus marinus CUG1438]|nr:hypothetical protein [Prochlorococcus marinus CUG1438]
MFIRKSIDYKKEGIGGWYFYQHTDLFDEPYYFDTYKHTDGRLSNLYPDDQADDPELEKLIKQNKKIINSEHKKAKYVRIFSRFIFLPHWFFILISGFNNESMPDGLFLLSLVGYSITFISFYGLFNNLKGLNLKSLNEIVIFLTISFVGFLIISVGEYRSIDLYGVKINLYLIALILGNLRGFLYSIEKELTSIHY